MAQQFVMKVSTEVMRAQATKVDGYIKAIKKDFDEIRRVVNASKSYWVGDASDKHRSIFGEREDDIDLILRRLAEHPNDLRKMAGIYEEAEQVNEILASQLPENVI